MNLDQNGLDPERKEQKLALLRQHHTEWQLCFVLEAASWHSLQQKHSQQRRDLMVGPAAFLKGKQLLQEQIQDIKDWHSIMARYRQKLAAQQAEESLNLEEEKRALSTYFSA